ncbi:MAG: hypothetical protein A2W34_08500 [Chloroflexi bacterium RBG_16_64_32]|nr:MAG: hypothetical protein A2W34_08500 [Chloroflexi bacterium RBG_16_64_32]
MKRAAHEHGVRPRDGAWWRVHQTVLRRWIGDAFRGAPSGYAVKTDLFDEASGPYHHASDLPGHLRFIGLDIDRTVAALADARIGSEDSSRHCVVGDVRRLPFPSGSAAAVLSLSTLDHFDAPSQIHHALIEIHRLLRPGGAMLLTLDNPRNLEVALREVLPRSIVRRLRADRFPIGKTLTSREGTRVLTSVGFEVEGPFYIDHSVRYPSIRIVHMLEHRAPSWAAWMERLLLGMEKLAATPLAPITGHYVAWIASKPRKAPSTG